MTMTWAGVDAGWILETNGPVSQSKLLRIWEYTLRDQERKISKMVDGQERRLYQDALIHLKNMKITHTIKPQGGAN